MSGTTASNPDYEFASLKPEHYTAVAGLFDINNLKLLMGIDLSDYVNAVSRSYTDVEWADLVHATDGIVYDLPKVVGLPSKAENNALTRKTSTCCIRSGSRSTPRPARRCRRVCARSWSR